MSEIIQLISGPRNLSTALMYSFGNREDTGVVDEPFYAHYLLHTGVDHPGRTDTINSMIKDPVAIINSFYQRPADESFYFIKNMAHHFIGFDHSYAYRVKNIFLIRDLKKLIHSFSKVIEQPTTQDIAIKREYELYKDISSKSAVPQLVLDSGELLKNPKIILTKVCKIMDIPWSDKMLRWPPGPRKEDGVWATYWYTSVHQSTHFSPQKTTSTTLNENLVSLYEENKRYYEELYELSIKAE